MSPGSFFNDFYSNSDVFKHVTVACSVAISLIEMHLLSRTIAFERSGPESHRTILARLMSAVFLYGILYVPLVMWPQIAQSFTGPWPQPPCDALMVVESVVASTMGSLVTVVTLLKAAFIFKLKSDDLLVVFFNVWAPLLSLLFTMPLVLLPGYHPFPYLVCIGRDVNRDYRHWQYSPRIMLSKLVFHGAAFVVVLATTTTISWMKLMLKFTAVSAGSVSSVQMQTIQQKEQRKSLVDLVFSFVVIISLVAVNGFARYVHLTEPDQVGATVARIYLHLYLLGSAGLLMTVYFLRHPSLMKFLWKDIREIFGLSVQPQTQGGVPIALCEMHSLFLNASEVYLLVKTLEFVEKGPENQRTILARLMSGVIRYAIAYVPLVMWPQIVQSFTGPWPSLLCDIFLVLEHVIGTTIVILIVVFTVLKPAFIFKFKSVWALKDEILMNFFNIWAPLLSALFAIPLLLLPGHYPFPYLTCVGADVNRECRHWPFSPRMMFSRVAFQISAFVVIFAATTIVSWMKLVTKASAVAPATAGTPSLDAQQAAQNAEQRKSLVDLAFNAVILASLVGMNSFARYVHVTDPEKVGVTVARIYLHLCYQTMSGLVMAVYYARHDKLRRFLWKDVRKKLGIDQGGGQTEAIEMNNM